MSDIQERRQNEARRIILRAPVEICGNQPDVPAFEAESVDISNRGMHLRTAYLPQVGDSLVCRLEDGPREVVVEGVVAWARQGAEHGEFGVQFTALDSRSVDALRALCSPGAGPGKPGSGPDSPGGGDAGAKVRLFIEGLGTPMKARVRQKGGARLEVGSNLEFLRVGRALEIENSDGAARRNASIDSVRVVLDPQTQVPQLVVALRLESESTPEPSVIDFAPPPEHTPLGLGTEAAPVTAWHFDPADSVGHGEEASENAEAPSDDEGFVAARDTSDDQLEATEMPAGLRSRMAAVSESAEHLATSMGGAVQRFGSAASTALQRAARGAHEGWTKLAARRRKTPLRRTTEPPPSSSLAGRRLRPQNAPMQDASRPIERARQFVAQRKLAVSAVALTCSGLLVALIAMRSAAPPAGARNSGAPASTAIAANESTSTPQTPGAAPSSAPAVAVSAARTPPASGTDAAKASKGKGITADVPLFGPTPMATMEPAPPGPDPSSQPGQTEEAREKALAQASVSGETFPSDNEKAEKSAAQEAPQVTKPWGRGKMHAPTVHRLRLSQPGEKFNASPTANGFKVLILDRKVMESPNSILKRDQRISRIATRNDKAGAQVAFQFRGAVPAYRVRLRKDFIEFLISAPGP